MDTASSSRGRGGGRCRGRGGAKNKRRESIDSTSHTESDTETTSTALSIRYKKSKPGRKPKTEGLVVQIDETSLVNSLSKNVVITPTDVVHESSPEKPKSQSKKLEKKIQQLPVDDVEIVRVTLFQHGSKNYFREPLKNKVFEYISPTSIGSYVGRWNSHTETIEKSIPDSDSDSNSNSKL